MIGVYNNEVKFMRTVRKGQCNILGFFQRKYVRILSGNGGLSEIARHL
jgi:hypothetical protein